MHEIIIKRGKNKPIVVKLKEPDFDVYRIAIMAYQSISGEGDKLAAGKIVLETCCTEGLDELRKDQKAFISACLEAVGLLTFYDTEVKKK